MDELTLLAGREEQCSPIATRTVAPCSPAWPFRGRVSNLLRYLNVAMDEDDHALEHVAGLGKIRRMPCVSLGVDIF